MVAAPEDTAATEAAATEDTAATILGAKAVASACIRRRWSWVHGVALGMLVFAFSVGRTTRSSTEFREVAMVTPSGRTVGEAYLHDGDPSWVFAAVPGWKDDLTEFRLHVTLADGSSTDATGIGSWGAVVRDTRQVRSLALLGADGRVWCSAAV